MSHSFVAFIDESGDDGLGNLKVPGAHGGQSHFLVISATVFRATNSVSAVRWRDEILAKMPEKKKRQLHFQDMSHAQRLMAAQTLAGLPLRVTSVLAAKSPIPPSMYTGKNQLYFYMTRYLLERLSWLCRDFRKLVPEGDGRVKITFSRRGGMSYEAFRDYLRHLQQMMDGDVRIHWPVIDIEAVDARDHSTSAKLQLADIVASSVACAFEPDRYGNCEPRYAEALLPVTFCRKGNRLSYGLKIVPNPDKCGFSKDQERSLKLLC